MECDDYNFTIVFSATINLIPCVCVWWVVGGLVVGDARTVCAHFN